MLSVMKIDEILALMSCDFGSEVRKCLDRVDITSDYHQKIRERMKETGINKIPVYVCGEWLENGHHRVKIAVELGHQEMRVTDDGCESGPYDCFNRMVA